MTINPDGAFSRGDMMRRITELENQVRALSTARRLPAAKVGRGGLRVQGGLFRAQDSEGDDMFRVGGDPGELFLREDLLAPFARAVLASGITSRTAEGTVTTGSTTFVELSGGPTVSVEIGETGRALVFLSAVLGGTNSGTPANLVSIGARMGFEITGATQRTSTNAQSLATFVQQQHVNDFLWEVRNRHGITLLVEDLNPGQNTFTALYASLSATSLDADFSDRNITVVAF